MRDKLPEDHDIFIAAISDMRLHFEDAAKRSPDHSFVLESVAYDLLQAERLISGNGLEPLHVERARVNLILAAEGSHYYPMVAHEFDAALDIALEHQRKLKGPGA